MKRVLVVEDDTFFAQLITEFLAEHGLDSTVVTSAQEALSIDCMPFDGAIVDVMLPNDPQLSGISTLESRGGFAAGLCVAKRLLQRKQTLPIILCTSDITDSDAENWAQDRGVWFTRKSDGLQNLTRVVERAGLVDLSPAPKSFIVHGHDELALLQLKDFIVSRLGWPQPIILREAPSFGKTIVEKFESYATQADYVFVLLTPDDAVSNGGIDRRQARPNVIFELGFFCGFLRRTSGRILLLHKECTDLPSDLAGVIWVDISRGIESAGELLRRELGL